MEERGLGLGLVLAKERELAKELERISVARYRNVVNPPLAARVFSIVPTTKGDSWVALVQPRTRTLGMLVASRLADAVVVLPSSPWKSPRRCRP